MAAIFDRFSQFFFRQWAVNVEGNRGFFDGMPHEGFQRLQANGWVRHHIIVDQGVISKQAGKPITGLILKDDPIIHLFGIEPAQDTLQNVLIIVPAVISGPNGAFLLLIEAAQFFRVIDDHGFFFGVQVYQHHQPIISEHLEIIKDHLFTHFLNVLSVNQ